MLNNKGFAVSTILYTILIAFLLFLGITLSMFSSSNSIISNANNDLVNGTVFRAVQVKDNKKKGICGQDYAWYQMDNNILIKITSRYGVIYWPRDFINYDKLENQIKITKEEAPTEDIENLTSDKKFFYKYLNSGYINLSMLNDTYNNIEYEMYDTYIDTTDLDGAEEHNNVFLWLPPYFNIKFRDINSGNTTTLTVSDICS